MHNKTVLKTAGSWNWFLGILLSGFSLVSCTGQVYEIRESGKTEGITVYPLIIVIEEWKNTVLVDKDGNLKADEEGKSGNKCTPVPFEKVVTRPDYNHPYRIYYDHGFLEHYDFSLELVDGALKSLNVKSSADRGETLKNLAGAAKDASTIAAAVRPLPLACTSGPKFVQFRK